MKITDLHYINKHIEFLRNEIKNSNGGYKTILKKSLDFFEKYKGDWMNLKDFVKRKSLDEVKNTDKTPQDELICPICKKPEKYCYEVWKKIWKKETGKKSDQEWNVNTRS